MSCLVQIQDSLPEPQTRIRISVLPKVFGCLALLGIVAACCDCAHVQPLEREKLASPAMRFEMDPVADGQRDSIHEITEGGTFPSAGPGNAGAGCGCN